MLITVKTIATQGQVALVEWVDDFTHRAVVPATDVVEGMVEEVTLARGVPFGMDIASVISLDYSALLAEELHRRGLWNGADILARPEEARSACVTMAAQVLAVLLRESKRTVNSNG